LTLLLSLAAALFGTIHIVADHRRAWVTTWWSKPATVIALLALVVLLAPAESDYAFLIIVGLGASLTGDIFLMLRPERFLAGLAAFLVAHLIYIVAFAGLAWPGHPAVAIVLAVFAAVILRVLEPGLGPLRWPVLGYVLAIAAMVWLAVSAWLSHPSASTAVGAAGAVLFLASDTSLGVARFRWRYPGAQAVTLVTYYLGQWLIALSAVWSGAG
jgi:uncharacterized membrane protein YhhN